MNYKKRLALVFSLLMVLICAGFPGRNTLKIEYPGKIVDCQGVTSLRPPSQERWTPLAVDMYADAGDLIRTDPRGANAVRVLLSAGGEYIIGPGSLVEVTDQKTIKITRGEVEITSPEKNELTVVLPGNRKEKIKGSAVLRVKEDSYEKLDTEPAWLKYFKGTIAREPMGSLLATVEGRNLPLTIGYHKVTVDIRDQIARTTIEESFKNNTDGTLEGVFHFPLPQDASISGFGMWIGDELVEADVVEKQRAREIYETILRERRDPGLLEWQGGNIFKARVFPIFGHSEKRIKITYTQVLPMENGQYRYSYALQSEMLKQFPLRELEVKVQLHSEQPLKSVLCPTHETRLSQTKNAASIEFSAQEYTPKRDFEVVVETGKGPEVVVIPHRRGEDGYFLLQVAQPDAGRKGRALITDGPPLDLIVMADTSASMDEGQRRMQEEFIAFLMGSLGSKDKLRVAAVDMDCHWLTAADADSVLDFLQHRASLGTTDLEKVFEKIFEVAGESTHIIYLGDAVDTTREADPVDTAQRLKRLYKEKGKGTVHAVATGSSFESGVMKALASASGGSSRRLAGNTPARTGVVDILEELINPGIRGMEVSFEGVRIARVYPEELPNLPAGKQQIVLGRYLPTGNDQAGEVVVKGTYKGREINYTAPFVVKDAEAGNSFIPRLWARMHLDNLLEQGNAQDIKDEIVALSEEYHIMTPYTSFLVLESDEDRERFKVQRRVTMRDGEKFFADGREKADYQLRQKYMQMAGKWRQDLRRDLLRELLELGREHYNLATPFIINGIYGNRGDVSYGIMGKGGGGERAAHYYRSSRMGAKGGGEYLAYGAYAMSESRVTAESFDLELGSAAVPGSMPMPAEEGMDLFFDGNGLGDDLAGADLFAENAKQEADFAFDEPQPVVEKEMFEQVQMLKSPVFVGTPRASRAYDARGWNPDVEYKKAIKRKDRLYFDSSSLVAAQSISGYETAGQSYGIIGPWQPYWNNWIESLFPRLSEAAPEPVIVPQPDDQVWPEDVKKLVNSLLRQPALDKMAGGLVIDMEATWFGTREESAGKSMLKMTYSPESWTSLSGYNGGQSLLNWKTGEQRAVYAPCYGLGRQRKTDKTDSNLVFHNFGYYNDYSLNSLEGSYRNCQAFITEKGPDKVLLTLKSQKNNSGEYKIEFLIDTKRNVVMEQITTSNGAVTSTLKLSNFVQAGGCWWAQNIESRDKDGKLSFATTASVKEITKAELAKLVEQTLPTGKDSIIIEHILPDYEIARQAKLDGKMTLEHQLAFISFYTNTQQWEKARDVWKEASKLISGRPGLGWIDIAVHIQTRRYEEARQMILAKGRLLAEKDEIDEYFVGNQLVDWSRSIAQVNERMDLLNVIKPVYESQPEYLKAVLAWKREYANALTSAGRNVEALAIWKELTGNYPDDTNIARDYIGAMVNNGQMEEAFAWMNEALAKKGFWADQERENLRNSVIYQFENRIDADMWLKFLTDWIDEGTINPGAYQKYLVALYRMHRTEEAHRLVEKWAREGLEHYKKTAGRENNPAYNTDEWKAEQKVVARIQAAVQQMLGQNNGYYGQRNHLEERWHQLLAEIARETYRIDQARNITQQIMVHHLFSNIDAAAEVRRDMKKLLFDETATLKANLIHQLVVWVAYGNPKVEKDEWAGLAEKIEKRLDIGKDEEEDRHSLATALVSVLAYAQDQDGLTRFLRKQWKTGPEKYKKYYLGQLFNNLLNKPWTEDIETELFSLIEKHTEVELQENLKLVSMVPVLMQIVDRMVEARQAASLEKVEGKDALSRVEYQKLTKEHEKTAWAGIVKRLNDEKARQPGELHPWLDVERLYFEMKLGVDPALVAAGCWKLLPPEPPACKKEKHLNEGVSPQPVVREDILPSKTSSVMPAPEEEPGLTVLEAGLIDRCLTTLSCLAARNSADKGIVVQVFDYIDRGIKFNPELPYWRYQKYRLLVGRNEPELLEKALGEWISPDKADDTWRLALGYLLAELDRVEDAVKQFEAIEKNDGLGAKEYNIMAGWYLVLDQKEKSREAELKELMVIDENQLANRLNQILNPWYRNDDKVPEELDPMAIKIFTALFKKSPNPQYYVYRLRDFYRYTKDFRLLECMSEGVIGHTAAQVYPYVQGLKDLLNDVREEAAVDSAMEYLAKVREKSQTRIDERALDIIEMLLRRRAAEVRNQPGPHIEKALAAMQRAFKGEWATGERRLMADLLRSLGTMSSESLKKEQLRELKELFNCQDEPAQDRLHIALQYAICMFNYDMKDEAIDLLESALAEYRQKNGGVLSDSANNALSQFISYLEIMKQFMRGEKYLDRELQSNVNDQQKYWLIQRKFDLYTSTLSNGGSVSLGEGQTLFNAVIDLYVKELDRTDQNHRQQIISKVSGFFRTAKGRKIDVSRMKEFAFDIFPKFLAKETNQYNYHNHVSNLSSALRDVLGPETALEFLIVMIEIEPEWIRSTYDSGWSRHSYQLAQYRKEVKNLGALEPRLLNIVLAELRRDLEYRNSRNRNIYWKHNSYYWKEKESDFMGVAEEVWNKQKDSGAAALFISDYMWDGLDRKERAVEVLAYAYKNELLDLNGRIQYVNRLHHLKRYKESLPVLEGLIKEQPDAINHRVGMIKALHNTEQEGKAREMLDLTDKYFHKPALWQEHVVYSLAQICREVGYNKEALAYYNELIPMHKRSHPQRGVGSHQLSSYYRELAMVCSAMKLTAEAVDAASGAIIVWSKDNNQRAQALRELDNVVAQAQDMDEYVATVEKGVEETGLENPILRKAIGRAYLGRNDYQKAIRHLKAAVEAQSNDAEMHKALIEAYDRMNDHDGAVGQILESVKLSRRDINLYKDLGDRYRNKLKNEVESERAYMSIAEMLPHESEGHTMLAEIRQGQNRWDEAIYHWKQVARVRSLEPTGFLKLAEAQIHQKKFDDASQTIKILESRDWPERFGNIRHQIDNLRRQLPAVNQVLL